MAAKSQAKVRKNPKQDRSRSLVGSVLDASARILERSGYAEATTNKIAEIAGVSIGSLYQYFPGKDAVLGALLEKQVQSVIEEFEKTWQRTQDKPNGERVDALVDRMVDKYMDNGRVQRELLLIVTRLQKVEDILQTRTNVVKRMAGWMEETLAIENAEVKSFVLLNAFLGVLLTAIVDRNSKFEREVLKIELRLLSRNYLGI